MQHDGALSAGSDLGQYQILQVIGRGGFGITYEAIDRSLNRRVAIKEFFPFGHAVRDGDGTTLIPSRTDASTFTHGLERFLDEARTLAQFRDPRIVHVHGFTKANGTAYMMMDYEEGDSLRERVLATGTLDPAATRRILVDILSALRVIHQRGFLHRDVKPGNIICRADGSIVLLDFGSARMSQGEGGAGYTVMVTPGYAPIEQYDAEGQQGPATDLYAAGACALFCLRGSQPPDGLKRAVAIQSGHPDPVEALLEGEPFRHAQGAGLAAVIRALLQPQAGQRPGTAQAALDLLAAVPAAPAPAPRLADLARQATIPPDRFDPLRRRFAEEVGGQADRLLFASLQGSAHVQQVVERLAEQVPDALRRSAFIDDLVRLLLPAPAAPAPAPAPAPAAPVLADEATTQFIGSVLATFIGPIARMLVRKRLTTATSRQELIDQLAAEIPDPGQSSAFRKAVQRITDPATR